MKQKILILNSLVVLIGLLLFSYWYFVDGVINPPVEYYHDLQNMEVSREVYQRGDYVSVYVDFCKKRVVSGVSAWSLVDTVQLFYPEKTANAPIGCYTGWTEVVKLPTIVDAGVFHLEGTTYQQINPLKRISVDYKTEEFYIE